MSSRSRVSRAVVAITGVLAAAPGAEGAPARPAFAPVPVERWTSSPLRHTGAVVLDAPIDSVWALVRDPRRMPEYSSLVRVELTPAPTGEPYGKGCRWRCHFPDGATTDEVTVYMQSPYAWAAVPTEEPWKSAGDLSVLVLEPNGPRRTIGYWRQYYDPAVLDEAMVDSYEKGIQEILVGLATRFGGYVVGSRAGAPVAPVRRGAGSAPPGS